MALREMPPLNDDDDHNPQEHHSRLISPSNTTSRNSSVSSTASGYCPVTRPFPIRAHIPHLLESPGAVPGFRHLHLLQDKQMEEILSTVQTVMGELLNVVHFLPSNSPVRDVIEQSVNKLTTVTRMDRRGSISPLPCSPSPGNSRLKPRASEVEEMKFRHEFLLQRSSSRDQQEQEASDWVADTFLSVPKRQRQRTDVLYKTRNSMHKAQLAHEIERLNLKQKAHRRIHSRSMSESDTSTSSNKNTMKIQRIVFQSHVIQCLDKLGTWEFDVFELAKHTRSPLVIVMKQLFNNFDFGHKLFIDEDKFISFVAAIEKKYLDNPYHNRLHAADVVANMNFWLKSSMLRKYVGSEVIIDLAAIIAACVHDVGHPGKTNAFLTETRSDLALLYNDQSILEHYHCSTAIKMLESREYNFCQSFDKEDRKLFRDTVVKLVLATDMSKHRHHMSQLQDMIGRIEGSSNIDSKVDVEDDRSICLIMAIHTSDIANPTKPLSQSLQWTARITEEFYKQGDQERRLHLPVTPTMDRKKPNLERQQLAFYEWIVRPLFTKWETLIPEARICLDNLEKNSQYWQNLLDNFNSPSRRSSDQKSNLPVHVPTSPSRSTHSSPSSDMPKINEEPLQYSGDQESSSSRVSKVRFGKMIECRSDEDSSQIPPLSPLETINNSNFPHNDNSNHTSTAAGGTTNRHRTHRTQNGVLGVWDANSPDELPNLERVEGHVLDVEVFEDNLPDLERRTIAGQRELYEDHLADRHCSAPAVIKFFDASRIQVHSSAQSDDSQDSSDSDF